MMQDKLDLLQFCINWQDRNNRQLSRKFIATYTGISIQRIVSLIGKKKLLKDIINFDTAQYTLDEICKKTNLSKKTVINYCLKHKLRYRNQKQKSNLRFLKKLNTKKLTIAELCKKLNANYCAVASALRRFGLKHKNSRV
jgi:hypothetical protein